MVQGGHPPAILSSGYIGSTVMGAAFVLAGFDTLVAKVMSFVAGIGILAPLVLVRDKLYVCEKDTVDHERLIFVW